MISSKDRSFLRAKMVKNASLVQVGKDGLTNNVFEQINQMLFDREIIKISVLKSCDLIAKEVMQELVEKIEVEPVSVVGSKLIVYKYSEKKDIHHVL